MKTVLHHWGVRSFVEHPTVRANGPGQIALGLAREDAMGILQHLQPTPEQAVEGVILSCGPVTRHTTLVSCGKKRREHLYCSGRNIIPGCLRMGRGDRSTCIYSTPEETSSPRPSSIPKYWKGEEERSWQLSSVVCGQSAPKTISPRPQDHQIGDLPRLANLQQTGIWKSWLQTGIWKSRLADL